MVRASKVLALVVFAAAGCGANHGDAGDDSNHEPGPAATTVNRAALIGAPADAQPTITFTQNALALGLSRANEPPSSSACTTSGTTLSYGTYLIDLDGDGLLDVYDHNHGEACHLSGLWINQ